MSCSLEEKKRRHQYYLAHKDKWVKRAHSEERRAHMKEWIAANKDHIKEYNKKWSESHREEVSEYVRVKYREDPKTQIRRRAAFTVHSALKKGEIKKQPCEICGNEKVHAHHDNYNNPLDIRWLCLKHHKEWHKNNKPIYP